MRKLVWLGLMFYFSGCMSETQVKQEDRADWKVYCIRIQAPSGYWSLFENYPAVKYEKTDLAQRTNIKFIGLDGEEREASTPLRIEILPGEWCPHENRWGICHKGNKMEDKRLGALNAQVEEKS